MKRLAWVSVCAALWTGCSRSTDIPSYYPLPEFSLTDQAGKSVTLRDLAGRVWVADFIFTSCGGTCPLITANMRKLQEVLPPEIRLLSITVDPARDTPEILAAYAGEHGAAGDRCLFVTGDKQDLHALRVHGFDLPLDTACGTAADRSAPSTRFVLARHRRESRG